MGTVFSSSKFQDYEKTVPFLLQRFSGINMGSKKSLVFKWNYSYSKLKTTIMKKNILSTLILLSVCFIACKKETTTKVQATQEKLLGKWNLVSELTNDYYGGTSHLYTLLYSPGDYVEFRNDGKYIAFTSGSSSTIDYGIVNDSQVWLVFPGNVYNLKSFTATGMQLYHKEVFSPTEYSESTLSLTK